MTKKYIKRPKVMSGYKILTIQVPTFFFHHIEEKDLRTCAENAVNELSKHIIPTNIYNNEFEQE